MPEQPIELSREVEEACQVVASVGANDLFSMVCGEDVLAATRNLARAIIAQVREELAKDAAKP